MPSFEKCIKDVLEEILLSDKDRQTFNHDSEEIRNYLMEEMKKADDDFRKAFDGLSLTGSSLDKLKINYPDEFDMNLKLKMPFNLTPRADPQRKGFVYLVADVLDHRFIGRKGKIVRNPLQIWLRELFLQTIRYGLRCQIGQRTYLITYPKTGRGRRVAHTVKAVEEKDGICTKRIISFDFVPAFEFNSKDWPSELEECKFESEVQPWFAIPFGKTVRTFKERSSRYTFRASAPHWERAAFHDKNNLKNSLRLMKALRDANDLDKLASYTMKSVYLQVIDEHSLEFWMKPTGEILIEMLKHLVQALDINCLPSFLHRDFNQLNLLPKKLIKKYKARVQMILDELEEFQNCDDVELSKVRAVFVR